MESVLEFIIPLIQSMSVKYPVIVSIIAVMGTLRIIFKPIMSVLHAYVESTETLKDDEKLAKAEASKYYKAIAWLVDFFASYKLKK